MGSIPNGVNGIFHLRNPSGRFIVLGSTHTLTEMSTWATYLGGGDEETRVGMATLPPSCTDCLEI